MITSPSSPDRFLIQGKSNKEVYVQINNLDDFETRFALIAIKDGKQIPFLNNEVVNYINVPGKSTQIFRFNLPKTLEDTNFQVLAFPNPFQVTNHNAAGPSSSFSKVTVINP